MVGVGWLMRSKSILMIKRDLFAGGGLDISMADNMAQTVIII